MTTFNFTRDVPDAPNDPSADQPKMKINNNSIDSALAVNHNGFNVADTGKHKYIQIPTDANPGGVTGGSEILLYNGFDVQRNLYFIPPNTAVPGGAIQMTRNEAPNYTANGFSWLPGGVLIQWGSTTAVQSSSSTVVAFPIAFPTAAYSVTTTVVTDDNSTIRFSIQNNATTTGFTTTQTNTAHFTNLYWMAIGK